MKTEQEAPPDADSRGWVKRQLPDNWNVSQPDRGGKAWYLFTFESKPPDDSLWSVYIPNVNMSADVYINGILVGSGGGLDEPLARNWFRPLIFHFSSRLLRPGLNLMHIRMAAYPNDGGGLSHILLGHAQDLKPLYEQLWAVRILPAILMVILMLSIIVLIVVFVLLRRKEKHYLWLAGAAFFCALFSLNFFLRDIPFNRHLWEAMTQISLGMTAYCMMMFINRFLNFRMRRLELGCALYFPLLGFALIAVPEVEQVIVFEWWQAGSIALVILMFILTARLWWRDKKRQALGIALGLALVMLSGAHDWMLSRLHLEFTYLYLQFSPFAVVAIAVGLWLSGLVTALNDYEQLNRNLNRLVEKKSAALRTALRETQLASAAKTRFFAAASHDLRQPLHSMALFLAGLEDHLRDKKGVMLAGKIRQGINMLRIMFDQLLDISRFEAGAMQAKKSTFPLAPMVERLRNEYAPLFIQRGLTLRAFIPDCYLFTDPSLLERVLRNYVENALRYTGRGGALIGCRRRPGVIILEVWDTGCGISDKDLQIIFDEFHRLDHPDKERGEGVGLGLSIVRHISRLLNLNITVRSRQGRGSVFSVEAPVGEPGRPELPATDELRGFSLQALEGRRIWAIDDDELALEGMELLLESWGCLCRSFSSPKQLMEFMRGNAERPEFIISDYSLQEGYTGVDLIHAIRQDAGEHIAAILVTGEASSDGQYDDEPMLHKPVEPLRLCEKMLALL